MLLLVILVLGIEKMAEGDTQNLLTAAQPAEVASFQVRDKSGTILWRISSPHPVRLLELRYGRVPAGFVQEVPLDGSKPRGFRDGESLITDTIRAEGPFSHRGVAVGEDGFLGGAWSTVVAK